MRTCVVPRASCVGFVFVLACQARADAVLVLNNPVVTAQRTQAADLAVKSRLPAIYLGDFSKRISLFRMLVLG